MGRGGGEEVGPEPLGDVHTQQLETEAQTAPITVDLPVVPARAVASTVTATTTTATTMISTRGTDTPAAEGARIWAKLAQFRKFDLPKFVGKSDNAWVIEHWATRMEKLFRDLHIVELDRSLERELERLKQGNHTVAEYERDFSRKIGLIPFAVRDEYHKARMFARGLRPNIRLLIASNGVLSFDECLDRALMVQSESEEVRSERDASERSGDRNRSHAKSGGGPSFSKKPPKHPRTQQSLGHLRAQCPRGDGATQSAVSSPAASRQNRGAPSAGTSFGRPSASRQNEGARQPSGGRVFALTQPKGDTGGDVLAGIVTLNLTRARAIFDTGASHSFISHSFAYEHGLSSRPLVVPLRIETPGGDLVADRCILSYPVILDDRPFLANLVVLPIKKFDVVLGMD
ncbi:uncharacterized protein LOC109705512 [Ananas comosus]|uniref:Uncharacterized protein LOC109705512 n=1 Tax=Ananas comosus TaxID=4615 RepID=A0A6P5EEL6_ANACO|nr:uncharacterized protein LOC109705512 [Ananas comosus]